MRILSFLQFYLTIITRYIFLITVSFNKKYFYRSRIISSKAYPNIWKLEDLIVATSGAVSVDSEPQ